MILCGQMATGWLAGRWHSEDISLRGLNPMRVGLSHGAQNGKQFKSSGSCFFACFSDRERDHLALAGL